MDARRVRQSEIPHTSLLFQDYLYQFARVSEFYPFPPFNAQSLAKSASAMSYSDEMRAGVVAALRQQYEQRAAGPETVRNLERLARSGCCAIVTGQQVGLFSGPAFTLYKALTTIKLARTLTEQGIEAVPVFWLATEDHDLAEVNHCFVQDREGRPVRLEYAEAPQVPNAPVGSVHFNQAIQPVIDSLRALLPASGDAKEICDWVQECYRPGADLGTSFARLLDYLFSTYGVVLLDSRDSRLHGLSKTVFQTALECASEIEKELRERSARLVEAGYHAQVRVAEQSTLLFLYEQGQRSALHSENGMFQSTLGNSYSSATLRDMLEDDPLLFSPNVLLRPVMQDTLLPTVAYVGGPSEIAYLAQAAPLYQRMLGRMPVIFPRAQFTVVDGASNRLLSKYGLELTDIFAGKQALREKMAARFLPEGLARSFEQTTANLNANFGAVKAGLEKLDPTLVDAASNSLQKMQYQLSNLEHKAAAAAQKRSDQVERDAQRLENNLYPEKTLQERFYSGISLLARFGLPLLDQLYEQISLDSPDHQIVTG